MCEAEGDLKNVNSEVQDKKENKVKTEKVVSDINENENLVNNVTTNEPDLEWDENIPF
jgi:hypothetical protein